MELVILGLVVLIVELVRSTPPSGMSEAEVSMILYPTTGREVIALPRLKEEA